MDESRTGVIRRDRIRSRPVWVGWRVCVTAVGLLTFVGCGVQQARLTTSGGSGPVTSLSPAVEPGLFPAGLSGQTSTTTLPTSAPRIGLARVLPSQRLATVLNTPMAHSGLYPPPSAAVAVNESLARANLEKVIGPMPSTYTPMLATYTNTDYSSIQPDGTDQPIYVGKLVWAYVATAPADQTGGFAAIGPNGAAMTQSFPAGTQCGSVWLVDALTAKYLMGYSYCQVPNPPTPISP